MKSEYQQSISKSLPLRGRLEGVLLFILLLAALCQSCKDDGSFSTSPANRLTLGVDTVRFDTVFSTVPAATRSFWIYNRSGDGIRCSTVSLERGNQSGFRVNVDGEFLSPESGYLLHNVEVRKGDSIRVFVETTTKVQGVDYPKEVLDNLVFSLESGVQQKVPLQVWSWDADVITDLVVKSDTTLSPTGRPMLVCGGIKVDSLATLTIAAGTTLYFQHGDSINVYGRLVCAGTASAPVTLRGARIDNMFDYLPYDNISGQWNGIRLHSSSLDNRLTFTDIHSTYSGVVCDSSTLDKPKLFLHNSTIHNCQGYGLLAQHCVVDMQSSQITNTLYNCVDIDGGFTQIINCTIAQFYPFSQEGLRGWALRVSDLSHKDKAVSYVERNGLSCLNSIITGYADDVILQDTKDSVTVFDANYRNCVLRTAPYTADTITCRDIVWEQTLEKLKPGEQPSGMPVLPDHYKTKENMFLKVDIDKQRYDFHLDSLACAIGAANLQYLPLTDRDGKLFDRSKPDIGCYSLSTSTSSATRNSRRTRKP